MKRITCDSCKKRRIPWWSKWLENVPDQWIQCRHAGIKITIRPRYLCIKCVEEMFSKLFASVDERGER